MDLNSLNINSFLKTDSKIPRIKDNLRKMTLGFYKLLNFSQLVLQDKPITVPLDIEAISFIFEKILKLPFSDSKFTLVGNTAVNQFWIKFSSHLMKYPLSSITEAYVDEHRITVRFQEEPDKLFKIALDKIGLEYNKAEVSIYKEFANSIEYSDSLVPIFSINENYTSIIAKTPHSPFSNYLKVDNIKEILSENNHFDVTTICEENPNLIPCIKYLENKIEKIANENRELKESNKNLTKLFTEMFSKNERMAIAKAPLSKEEIENLIYIHIKELASISKLSQDTFKNYHFVYDYENRKTLLLDYYFLKQPNSDYYQNF